MQPSYEKYVALRNNKHITDYQVALKCGFSRSTFPDWKSGRSVPKVQKLSKLAAFFGVPIEELLGEEEG